VNEELDRLRAEWPDEWRDAARCAFLQNYPGEREGGGYPRGFHQWPLSRRNAWFSGYSRGFHDRLRRVRELAK